MDRLEATNQDLEKALEDTKQKLEDLQEEHDEKLKQSATMKSSLRAEVEGLKAEVSKAKKLGVTEYQKSETYTSNLEKTTSFLLTKERIKL